MALVEQISSEFFLLTTKTAKALTAKNRSELRMPSGSSESPKRDSFERMRGRERSSEQIRISFALSWILSHSFTQKKFFFVNLTSPPYRHRNRWARSGRWGLVAHPRQGRWSRRQSWPVKVAKRDMIRLKRVAENARENKHDADCPSESLKRKSFEKMSG